MWHVYDWKNIRNLDYCESENGSMYCNVRVLQINLFLLILFRIPNIANCMWVKKKNWQIVFGTYYEVTMENKITLMPQIQKDENLISPENARVFDG